ncbi:unnamed protein product, partial [Prorocentrum cordatum]
RDGGTAAGGGRRPRGFLRGRVPRPRGPPQAAGDASHRDWPLPRRLGKGTAAGTLPARGARGPADERKQLGVLAVRAVINGRDLLACTPPLRFLSVPRARRGGEAAGAQGEGGHREADAEDRLDDVQTSSASSAAPGGAVSEQIDWIVVALVSLRSLGQHRLGGRAAAPADVPAPRTLGAGAAQALGAAPGPERRAAGAAVAGHGAAGLVWSQPLQTTS